MTLKEFCLSCNFDIVCGDENCEFEFSGVYTGDFLSRAMSKVEFQNLWVTVMTNTNVIAVASLTEASAVILAEGVNLPPEAKEAAQTNCINVVSSTLSAYEICVMLNKLYGENL